MTKGIEDGMGDNRTQKDWETIANHVGVPYERVGAFFGVAEMCGYRWTRVDSQTVAVPEAKPEPPATDRRKTMKLCIEFEPTDTRIMEFVRSLVPEGERLEFHEVCNDKAPIDEDAYIAMVNKLHALRVLVGRLPNHSKECESMTFRDPTKCDCVYGEIAKAIRE